MRVVVACLHDTASSLRPCLQAPKPFAAAKSLASKANGIAAAPRPVLAQQKQQQQPAALALKVECADGPRGMKLKTRKVRSWGAQCSNAGRASRGMQQVARDMGPGGCVTRNLAVLSAQLSSTQR